MRNLVAYFQHLAFPLQIHSTHEVVSSVTAYSWVECWEFTQCTVGGTDKLLDGRNKKINEVESPFGIVQVYLFIQIKKSFSSMYLDIVIGLYSVKYVIYSMYSKELQGLDQNAGEIQTKIKHAQTQ